MGEKMTNLSDELLAKFREICSGIRDLEISYSPEIEFSYDKLLNFLLANTADRGILSREIVATVGEYKNVRRTGDVLLSVDALAYCMHLLRWPEVLAAAEKEHTLHFSQKADSTLIPLIDSFRDDWEESVDYRRFAHNGVRN